MCKYEDNMKAIKKVIKKEKDLQVHEIEGLEMLVRANNYMQYFFNRYRTVRTVNIAYIQKALKLYINAKKQLYDGIVFKNDPLGFDIEDIEWMTSAIIGEEVGFDFPIGGRLSAFWIMDHLKSLGEEVGFDFPIGD